MDPIETVPPVADTAPDTAPAPDADTDAGVTLIERQSNRCDKIATVALQLHDFAAKTPDDAPWAQSFRAALEQADGALAEMLTALAAAPADYAHKRVAGAGKPGKVSEYQPGVRVQIKADFRDKYKSQLFDVEFGTTAIGEIKFRDEDGRRVTVLFANGARVLIATARLDIVREKTVQDAPAVDPATAALAAVT